MKHKYLIIMASLMMLSVATNAQVKVNVEKSEYPFELTTDPANPVLYYIFSGRPNAYNASDVTPQYVFTNFDNKLTIEYQDPRGRNHQQWYFIEEGEGVRIISAKDNRMISVATTEDAKQSIQMQTAEERTNDYYVWILDCTNDCYAFRTSDEKTFLSHNGGWNGGPYMGLYNADGSKDKGSQVIFDKVPVKASLDQIHINANSEDIIYTITGQRINNISEPGIYIVGGKKKIVR